MDCLGQAFFGGCGVPSLLLSVSARTCNVKTRLTGPSFLDAPTCGCDIPRGIGKVLYWLEIGVRPVNWQQSDTSVQLSKLPLNK